MKGKLMFAAGIAAGFVVGSRAGKQSYAAIKERAQTVAQSPRVQSATSRVVHTAKDFAEARAPKLTGVVASAASTVGGIADVAKDVPETAEETPEAPETDDAPVDAPVAADESAASTAPQA